MPKFLGLVGAGKPRVQQLFEHLYRKLISNYKEVKETGARCPICMSGRTYLKNVKEDAFKSQFIYHYSCLNCGTQYSVTWIVADVALDAPPPHPEKIWNLEITAFEDDYELEDMKEMGFSNPEQWWEEDEDLDDEDGLDAYDDFLDSYYYNHANADGTVDSEGED
jgi:hypothetical protein